MMINFLIQKALADTGVKDSGPVSSSSGGFAIQKPPGIPGDVCTLITNVTHFLVAVSIPIAGVMILYGAFLILTAAESPQRFEAGKNTILYTVMGLAIILLAQGLVFVVTQVLGSTVGSFCSPPTP